MVEAFSNLIRELKAGRFVFTGELEPHKSTGLSSLVERARTLKATGRVAAANVTDNPQSVGTMSSLVASYIIQRDSGLETVYQLRTADRNRLALVSDILGAAALGLRNILALTGDHTMLGDTAGAMPVFDLDSTQLVDLIHTMVHEGRDLWGNEIQGLRPPQLNVGVAANPNVEPIEPEIIKLERKMGVGAEFVQTQIVFDIQIALDFLNQTKNLGVPILIGIFPPKSYGQAKFFDEHVPGVIVPKELLKSLKEFKKINDKRKRREKIDEYNISFFTSFIQEIRKNSACRGCHIMAVEYAPVITRIMERTAPVITRIMERTAV